METNINIAKILKNVPIDTKLYSPLFGNVFLKYIGEMFITVRHHGTTANFYHNGRLYDYEGTEPMLFPSREMRDWSKFTWRKGDVLISREGSKILFDKWVNEDYTKFLGKIKVLGNSHCYDITYYNLVSEEEALEFIKSVEKINNGKLNRETLEIEKAQPEFKDGDILSCDENTYTKHAILIFHKNGDTRESIVSLIRHKELVEINEPISDFFLSRLDYATEEEKQQLFDALAKEGKTWDAEKKQIVDLPKKREFKPFDKVLVRDSNDHKWKAGIFSHYSEGLILPFVCVGGCYRYCIPYNEETAHLLDTTDD